MDVQLLIGNQDLSAANGAVFERRDPISGAVTTRAAAASVAPLIFCDAKNFAAAIWCNLPQFTSETSWHGFVFLSGILGLPNQDFQRKGTERTKVAHAKENRLIRFNFLR